MTLQEALRSTVEAYVAEAPLEEVARIYALCRKRQGEIYAGDRGRELKAQVHGEGEDA